MMKWIAFNKLGIEVKLKQLDNGSIYIFLEGGPSDISPQTGFGSCVFKCNSANSAAYKNWINFTYNKTKNVWYRPLGSLTINDLSPYFKDMAIVERDVQALELKKSPTIASNLPVSKVSANAIKPELSHSVPPIKAIGLAHASNENFDGRTLEQKSTIDDGVAGVGAAYQQADLFGIGAGGTGRGLGRPVNGNRPNESAQSDGGQKGAVGQIDPGSTGLAKLAPVVIANKDIQLEPLNKISQERKPNWISKQNGAAGHSIKNGVLVKVNPSTKSQRIESNIQSLQLLASKEDKTFTDDEKELLSQFSGWGGLAEEVVRGDIIQRLKAFMSPAQIHTVKSSALYGYYTDDELVKSLWGWMQKAGFNGGRIIEPSCGTGKFISNRIPALDERQSFLGVEIDKTSAAISQALHPSANIFDSPFEKIYSGRLSSSSFDLVIGNFPFGEQKIIDENGEGYSIHNYFMLKNLELLRKGGVMAIITSTHTLDSRSDETRKLINDKAQLLGVVRLPSGTFQGTSVISDILILRKRTGTSSDLEFSEIPFLNTAHKSFEAKRSFVTLVDKKTKTIDKGESFAIDINEAFTSGNPNVRMIGAPSVAMIGMGSRPGLILEGNLQGAIKGINELANQTTKFFDDTNLFLDNGEPDLKIEFNLESEKPQYIGNFIVKKGKVYVVTGYSQPQSGTYLIKGDDYKVPVRNLTNDSGNKLNPVDVISDYVLLRDTAMELLASESELNPNIESCNLLRDELNFYYDQFVSKHGFINEKTIRRIIRRDALLGVALSLENWDRETRKATKAQIFSESLIRNKDAKQGSYEFLEAISISFSEKGKADINLIESLTNKPIKALCLEKPGILFLDPVSGEYLHKTDYLVGNVVHKLKIAEVAANDNPEFLINTKFLADVVPPFIPAREIGLSLGSKWIPDQIIVEYVEAAYKAKGVEVKVKFVRGDGTVTPSIEVSLKGGVYSAYGLVTNSSHGTDHCSFVRILESLMTSTPIVITTKTAAGTRVDSKATITANNKLDFVRDDFVNWILADAIRSAEIESIYNSSINVYSYSTDYSDIDYEFKGMNPNWKPRDHQKSYVLSALIRGNMMNADCVGSGKTGMEVMLAHELKRLGIANMPIIVVPNHMLYQTAAEAQTIYPSAKICIVTKEDFSKENRTSFVAKIAMNDWDFGVITYAMFQQLLPDSEYLGQKLREQIQELQDALGHASSEGDRLSSRSILLKLQAAESRLEILMNAVSTDKLPLELGHTRIDSILYDEYHKLKNLSLNMVKSIPGINDSGSNIAFIEHIKMQYVMDKYHAGEEKGIYPFTATPISNSISELYNIFRMIKPSLLKQEGIVNFNDWAAQYGEVKQALEVLPEGKGFQMKARLSTFKNLPELLASFRTFTQMHTREQLGLPVPEYTEEVVTAKPNLWQQYIFDTLVERAQDLRNKTNEDSTDNFLHIVNDAAMAAISHRALLPNTPLPDQDTKLDLCIENVIRIYNETTEKLATQLIFIDKSTPSNKKWSAYEHIKAGLIASGIPENEIAFIHDADTDEKRFELFSKIRNGLIRVCLGSTEKLGTGTNVQDKLYAIHDVDIPWTPKELEQRLGRLVRPGNTNEHVWIYRYTTKGSFDVFRLETIKRKAVLIAAAFSEPRLSMRRYEEETEIDYDTIIAETTDNPIIKEKAKLDATIATLQRKHDDFQNEKFNTKYTIRKFKEVIEKYTPKYDVLHAANIRILEKIQSTPKLTIPLDISDNKQKKYEMYGRLAQASFTTFGKVDGLQDGDTIWIDLDGARAALEAVLMKSASNFSRPIQVEVYGEHAGLKRRVVNGHNESEIEDEIRYFDSSTCDLYSAFDNNAHYSSFTHGKHDGGTMIFRGVLNYLAVEMLSDLRVYDYKLKDAKAALKAAAHFDLDAVFPHQEKLTEAKARRAEIEGRIIELMTTIAAERAKKQITSLPEVLRRFEESGFDLNFNPYNITIGEEDIIEVVDYVEASAAKQEKSAPSMSMN